MSIDTSFQRLERLVARTDARYRHSKQMVTTYYELVTDLCQAGWGESQHFPPMGAGESLDAAQARAEQGLADRAGLVPGRRALDLCSGTGGPAVTIAQHSGAHVVGIDLSRVRVEKAHQRRAQLDCRSLLTFLEGDVSALPFPAESFDVCYTFDAICHSPDKQRVHAEAWRVLKPGGAYVGYDWLNSDGLSPQESEEFIEPICRHHGIPGLTTPTQLDAYLAHAGFGDIAITPEVEDMDHTWSLVEEFEMIAAEMTDPLTDFMRAGLRALCRSARLGYFSVGYWEAKRPGHSKTPGDSL